MEKEETKWGKGMGGGREREGIRGKERNGWRGREKKKKEWEGERVERGEVMWNRKKGRREEGKGKGKIVQVKTKGGRGF